MALAFIMVGILRPLAHLLPYRRAVAVARSLGVVRAAIPFYGRVTASRFQRTFGRHLDAKQAKRVAAEYLARPLCDAVVLRRMVRRGWGDFDQWHVEHRITASVDALRASDESFILATGHFSRQAGMPFYASKYLSQTITPLLLPPTKRTINPRTWWLSYHYGQMLDCIRIARPRAEFLHPGQLIAFRRLVDTLSRPRNAVIVYADAQMARKNGLFVRSFAGLHARWFATGAARLSRMTGRPIVVCIPYLVDDETIILDWTRVIRPPAKGDQESDIAVTNLILDDIEKAIGRRPGQYLLDFLGERRWDARAEQWVSS